MNTCAAKDPQPADPLAGCDDNPPAVPDDAWIDVRTIGQWLTVSPSWVFREVRQRRFPGPVFRGHRMTRWRAGTVRDWMRQREAGAVAGGAR